MTTLYRYATSHRIDVVDGLLRKDLSDGGLIGKARDVRDPDIHDPRREPEMYRRVLTACGVGPRCRDSGDDWVLLEEVDGVPLWQHGDAAVWIRTAAWVAVMHRSLRRHAPPPPTRAPLVVHHAGLYHRQADQARVAGIPEKVLAAHRAAVARVLALEPGVIHGDLYPSNVVVAADGTAVRAWPVDWELAGWGSPLLDLAALTAGRLEPGVRTRMLSAYHHASGTDRKWKAFRADVRACALIVCVQWLARSGRWTPPPEHANDWLAEAIALADGHDPR